MPSSGPTKTPAPSPSALRIFGRHPYLTFAGLAAFSAVLGARHMRNKIRDNDLAQKNSSNPNYYVTVERSGGGI